MRFEGYHEAQSHRCHHVDPQDLRCGDRHSETEEDGDGDNQRLGDVGWQHEQDRLFDIVVDRAPFFHRRCDGSEVVVDEDHLGRFLGDLGTLDAHRDADIGFLESRCIVHAVSGHCDDLIVRLDCLHKTELVFGARTREHVNVTDPLLQGGGIHLLNLSTSDRRLSVPDAEQLGDRGGSDLVVAGDHCDPDPPILAFLDGLDGLFARRVEQTDQTEEDQVPRQVCRGETACLDVGVLDPGQCEHAFALAGEFVRCLHEMRAIKRLCFFARGLLAVAVLENDFGRSLGEENSACYHQPRATWP